MSNQCTINQRTIDRLIEDMLSPDAFDAHAWAALLNTLPIEEVQEAFSQLVDSITRPHKNHELMERLTSRNQILVKDDVFNGIMKRLYEWRNARDRGQTKAHEAEHQNKHGGTE